jgi:putative tricarboxylic transport membrane protein
MKSFSKLFVLFLITLFVAFEAGTAVGASDYPNKPIILTCQASPGGGGDIFVRTLASAVQTYKLLPQPIVVENKPGVSTAYAYVAGKKKDPYYLVNTVPPILVAPLQGQSPVSLKDFTPIVNFAFDPFVLMASLDSKFETVNDVITYAKANPKKVTIGSVGTSDLCVYMFEKAAGIQLNTVNFTGGGELNAALLGGHIDLAVSTPGVTFELYKAGKVRMPGLLGEKRLAGAPDIPTMKEQGVDVIYVSFRGIAAPADIPADARKVLEEAFLKYTKTEPYKKWVTDNLLDEQWMAGEALLKWLERESAMYEGIIKERDLSKNK